jgi:hypothetical protein
MLLANRSSIWSGSPPRPSRPVFSVRFGKDESQRLNEVNPISAVRAISNLPGFRIEAERRLNWFERELALLSPTNPDYESEKRAIQAASQELRELIRQVTEPQTKLTSSSALARSLS